MLQKVDRGLGWLLVVGGLLHAGGSLAGYRQEPHTLLWALSGSLAALLVAALNLLRVERQEDRRLAWVCVAGGGAWAVVAVAFGVLVGSVLDPRALMHSINALLLAGLSVRTALRPSPESVPHPAA